MKIFTLFSFLLVSHLVLFSGESKVLNIVYVNQQIKIDGKLDEEFYNHLQPANNFSQFHPKNGEKATFKTEVYSFYDKKNIYFSFKCFDNSPQKIVADVTPFGEFFNNDEIGVYLDTFMDKRTYEYFAVNPKGIKEGKKTVWDADAKITKFGWSAEMKIPFKSLRFPVKDIQHWGVNFKRRIFRLNETSFWTRVERDKIGILGDTFAKLEGLKNIRGGKNIEIFPYTGYRNSYSADEKDSKFAYGLDLKYGITSNLTLDLTSSPDYSEVESDPFFYQIMPFEYGLRENRPFYYEGNSYFDTMFDLFYSRRITNPTLAAKLTGKERGFSFGILGARNKLEENYSFHGVFRLKKDVFRLSNIGIIYTSLEEGDNWNRNFGLDFYFKFKNIYTIAGMVARSYNKDAENSQNGMFNLRFLRVPDKGFVLGAVYNRVEPNVFVPAGFVTRVDFQRFWLITNYKFRWEGKWLESLILKFFKINENSISDNLKVADNYVFSAVFFTKNRITLFLSHQFGRIRPNVVNEDDELVWDKVLYPVNAIQANLSFDGYRVVQFGISGITVHDYVWNEDFTETMDGKYAEISLWTNFKISPQLQLHISYGNTYYRSIDKSVHFNGNLLSSSFHYQISKKLSSFLKFQYDSYLERFQYDFLIGYEPANVSKICLSIKNYSEHRFRLFQPDARGVAVKVSYLIRI